MWHTILVGKTDEVGNSPMSRGRRSHQKKKQSYSLAVEPLLLRTKRKLRTLKTLWNGKR